jgi:tripartite-type tricarboxylate transporter receptor subunit TctC
MPYKDKVADKSWGDIPTCKEQGLDVEYLMLRGIFMPGGATPDQVAYYVGVLRKVQEAPEWKQLMEQGAFNTTALEGKEYADWVAREEARHISLMKAAGFIHGQK